MMKICVLLPDYTGSSIDYQYFDPPRDLSHLMPEARFDHILINKISTYRQIRDLKKHGYDIFVNLCEGYLEWDVPSIDVIQSLELLDLPFTGPNSRLYDPPKELMKYVAYCAGVNTPAHVLVSELPDVETVLAELRFPLFVKPSKAGDSLGVDSRSLVKNEPDLREKIAELHVAYEHVMVEEYIDGREFTVMIAANANPRKTCTVFKPVEFIFPEGNRFKTYALKTSELHPEANVPVTDTKLDTQLRSAAAAIFKGFEGVGYARLDFRANAAGELYFLEINFTCSVFYKDGYEGSADYILNYDGFGQAAFLRHIIEEGMARFKNSRKKYQVRGNSISGYGIYAATNIVEGEIVYEGEEKSQRVATRRHIEKTWDEEEQQMFRQYAYPLSKEVFLLWDDNPAAWAPQNHSCDPNTAYRGLNVFAIKNISRGEELTLDYSSFLDEKMEAFDCNCGSKNCRGRIEGVTSNSITEMELKITSRFSA